ncbi:MAG: helix-hairpin-helix domain-containing protein [Chloroflexota bacterium]|nr:helix-hairpin-helix domain-containing protein [Chloroflexota bacterium]MDE2684719.1 helix-hairpin-helix domain-containing protein [Chloroflexota bacterium]
MVSVGSRKFLATVVSVLAAVVVLGVAAWMLMGNNGGGPQADADVRIVPPVDAANADTSIGTDAPIVSRHDETPVPVDIAVYLTGEVINPGVYTVAPGQRLTDVVNLAGGPTENADLGRVNLAAYVSDAAHYRIPAKGATDDSMVGAVSDTNGSGTSRIPSTATCAVPVDINVASAECLETLPGIGSVRAQSIVAHRDQAGPFVTADSITAVPGIGDGIYGRIADMITVNSR